MFGNSALTRRLLDAARRPLLRRTEGDVARLPVRSRGRLLPSDDLFALANTIAALLDLEVTIRGPHQSASSSPAARTKQTAPRDQTVLDRQGSLTPSRARHPPLTVSERRCAHRSLPTETSNHSLRRCWAVPAEDKVLDIWAGAGTAEREQCQTARHATRATRKCCIPGGSDVERRPLRTAKRTALKGESIGYAAGSPQPSARQATDRPRSGRGARRNSSHRATSLATGGSSATAADASRRRATRAAAACA